MVKYLARHILTSGQRGHVVDPDEAHAYPLSCFLHEKDVLDGRPLNTPKVSVLGELPSITWNTVDGSFMRCKLMVCYMCTSIE